MCSRDEFVAVFDKILDAEIDDIRKNYELPELAANWVKEVGLIMEEVSCCSFCRLSFTCTPFLVER